VADQGLETTATDAMNGELGAGTASDQTIPADAVYAFSSSAFTFLFRRSERSAVRSLQCDDLVRKH
jgi:hypothetical protein